MLTAAAAVTLIIALIIDVSHGGHVTAAAAGFAVAGMALIVLGAVFPHTPRPRRQPESAAPQHTPEPHYGHTKHGQPVHLHTLDHLPVHNAYARLNKTLALKITGWVGSMSCAWIFCLLALASLPAVLTQAFHLHVFPSWLISVGLIALVAWIAQTFLQLVLLSIILVGTNVSAEAGDARSAKTFDDAEETRQAVTIALDRLDETTEGGLKAVLDAVIALAAQVTAPRPAQAKRLATRTERGKEGSGT